MAAPYIGPPITVRLSTETLDRIEKIAEHAGETRADILRNLIDIALDDYEWEVAT